MKTALIYTVVCAAICLCLAEVMPQAQNKSAPAAGQPAQSAAKDQAAKPVERPFLISAPKVFTKLERPPVKFNHDKHTTALEQEGCERCHAKDTKGVFTFSFPKVRNESSAKALMNSFHDECIGCHQKRAAENKKAGPTACGECHRDEKESGRKEYVPVLPEYYDVVKDAYHKDCLACHREPAKPHKEAESLDWQKFYLREKKQQALSWPKMVSDYQVHDKHYKGLDKKCDPCHYMSPARRQKLAADAKQPTNRDWLLDIDEANSLTDEKAVHARCLNCHLTRKAENKKGGPFVCSGCHSGIERTIKQMADVPRPLSDQTDKYLIELKEDARAKSVPFNHKSHETNSRSCQECHHKTVRSCGECHTTKPGKEGGGVSLAEAYHKVTSSWSCIGCHETVKKQQSCAGCHARMENGLAESSCNACHTGDLKSLNVAKLPPPKELLPNDAKDEMAIGVMEKSYKPSKMPHLAISRKLTDLSNQSTLAGYFHRDETTICAGCHHHGPVQKKIKAMQCGVCHMNRQQAEGATPTLLGAYHQQCLGCHKQMVQTEKKKLPQNCVGCHEEKRKG